MLDSNLSDITRHEAVLVVALEFPREPHARTLPILAGREYHPIRILAGLEVKVYLTETDMSMVVWLIHPTILGGVVEWEH